MFPKSMSEDGERLFHVATSSSVGRGMPQGSQLPPNPSQEAPQLQSLTQEIWPHSFPKPLAQAKVCSTKPPLRPWQCLGDMWLPNNRERDDSRNSCDLIISILYKSSV